MGLSINSLRMAGATGIFAYSIIVRIFLSFTPLRYFMFRCSMITFTLLLVLIFPAVSIEFPSSGGLDINSLPALSQADGAAARAVDHFRDRVQHLRTNQNVSPAPGIRVGLLDQDERLQQHFTPAKISNLTLALKPFQRDQAYAIALAEENGHDTLLAGSLTELGTAYAISELEIRLRVRDNGEVYLDFPEWDATGSREIFDFPAIEERGEYLNIGYNIPGITPHEWDTARWQAYIDKLVLAKLNRLYFYLWNDTYSMNPASALSQRPLSKSLHENLRTMIAYAHRRGLEVIYMCSPTFFPRDLWDAHPEIHAEIVYVDHGFPAVCPNAPGAWDLMLANARSEMSWFAEADAIQVWFYDPGGCWCEKNGCATHQAESIAKQFKTFGELFREFNPKAKLEYNFWPVWVWEDIKKFQYRDDINARIKESFSNDIASITAVGGDNGGISFPVREKALGFRGATFLFATNPESGYSFLIPSLRWTPALIKEAKAADLNGAFGHRLEAWTRYPATFFMGQALWNPEIEPHEAVHRWATWQCARRDAAERLSSAIELLEKYTDDGPTAELGKRMAESIQNLWPDLPAAAKEDLEYFPAMFACFSIIGESIGVEDEERLVEFATRFTDALGQSPTFAPLQAQGPGLFKRYRELLKPGWKVAPF